MTTPSAPGNSVAPGKPCQGERAAGTGAASWRRALVVLGELGQPVGDEVVQRRGIE